MALSTFKYYVHLPPCVVFFVILTLNKITCSSYLDSKKLLNINLLYFTQCNASFKKCHFRMISSIFIFSTFIPSIWSVLSTRKEDIVIMYALQFTIKEKKLILQKRTVYHLTVLFSCCCMRKNSMSCHLWMSTFSFQF